MIKRKSLKLYKNTITVSISNIRKEKWPLDLYVSILLIRSFITILVRPALKGKEIDYGIFLNRVFSLYIYKE